MGVAVRGRWALMLGMGLVAWAAPWVSRLGRGSGCARFLSEELAPERHHRRGRPVCAEEVPAEFLVDVVGEVGAVDDDVGLVDRQHRVPVGAPPGWQVAVRADGDHLGGLAELLACRRECLAGAGRTLAPGGMPQGVVLDVEERSLDGPAKSLAQVAGVCAAPVRPRAAPPWRGGAEW